jgi:hypothetical protein
MFLVGGIAKDRVGGEFECLSCSQRALWNCVVA